MPSFIPHLVVPLLLALAFIPVERWRIWAWAPLVWAPDLDFFLPVHLHRALLSNVFIPLTLVGVMVLLWRRRDPTSDFWEFATRPGAPANLFLATFYVSGHILMDVFAGGVVLFWPVWDRNFFWFVQILVDTQTGETHTTNDVGTEPGIPEYAPVYEWLSTVDVAMVVLVILVAAGSLWKRRRAPIRHFRVAKLDDAAAAAQPPGATQSRQK